MGVRGVAMRILSNIRGIVWYGAGGRSVECWLGVMTAQIHVGRVPGKRYRMGREVVPLIRYWLACCSLTSVTAEPSIIESQECEVITKFEINYNSRI
jgi:hypothetical protein